MLKLRAALILRLVLPVAAGCSTVPERSAFTGVALEVSARLDARLHWRGNGMDD